MVEEREIVHDLSVAVPRTQMVAIDELLTGEAPCKSTVFHPM
jgi:hypothetical protein